MAWGIGWLRHIQISQLVAGRGPIYFAPGVVFLLSAASWLLLAIPGLVLAALLLTFSLKLITSVWCNRVLLRFLISGAVALVLWLLLVSAHDKNAEGRAWDFFLIFLETTWALIFGLALMAPRPLTTASTH